MQLIKYGIVLKSIDYSHIEQVRTWRNSDHVRLNMEYKELISFDQQTEWFNNLNLATNIYLVIIIDTKPIGLVNLKNIDWGLNEAEAGIFIGDNEHHNSITPILSTISLMEFAFEVLKLKTLKAKIAANNHMVITFNKKLGYKKCISSERLNYHYYNVTENDFYYATQNLRQTLQKINKKGWEILISKDEIELLNIDINNIKIKLMNIKPLPNLN